MPEVFRLQNAFNQGELSPRVTGRGDLQAYAFAAARVENWIPSRPGGLERRPGTRFVEEVLDSSRPGRLTEFIFNREQSYALCWNGGQVRVFRDEAPLFHGTFQVRAGSDIDLATSEVFRLNHGLSHGDKLVFTSTTGVPPLGLVVGETYYVDLPPTLAVSASDVDVGSDELTILLHGLVEDMGPFRLSSSSVLPSPLIPDTDYWIAAFTANTITLAATLGGAIIDITTTGVGVHTIFPSPLYRRDRFRLRAGSPFGPLVVFGDVGSGVHLFDASSNRVRESHPYADNELFAITYAQSADVLYLVHPSHIPRKLQRFGDTAWILEDVELRDGPYLPINTTPVTFSLDSAAVGAGRTLTASEPFFTGADVGRIFRMGDTNNPVQWGWGKITTIGGVAFGAPEITFDGLVSDLDIDDTAGNETVTTVGHGFQQGEPVVVVANGGTLPTGLSAGVVYYIGVLDANTYFFALTPILAGSGVGDPADRIDLTKAATDQFDVVGQHLHIPLHGFATGDGPLRLTTTGTLPAGLSATTDYFAEAYDVNTLRLALSPGGDPGLVQWTTEGTGTHSINGGSGLVASVTVQLFATCPTTGPTVRWRLGAFGGDQGFPAGVGFYENRLFFGGVPAIPNTIYGSQSSDYENFAPDDAGVADGDHTITDGSGLSFSLVESQVNDVEWIVGGRTLLVGTQGGIFSISGATSVAPLTPTTISARLFDAVGSSFERPVRVVDEIVHVAPARRRLIATAYDFDSDAYIGRDLSILADHLTDNGLFELTFTEEPTPIVWGITDQNRLIGITYDRRQQVQGWHRHQIGGSYQGGPAEVLSLTTIFSADQSYSQLWMLVRRTIDGQTRRYVEFLDDRLRIEDDFRLHAGQDSVLQVLDLPAPVTSVAGLEHLEGETVQIMVDGASHPDRVVSAGEIELDGPASQIAVGLPFNAQLITLPVVVETQLGPLQGRAKRVVEIYLDLFRTLGLRANGLGEPLQTLPFRKFDQAMDAPPEPFTGIYNLHPEATWNEDGEIVIEAPGPHHAYLRSLILRVEASQR